MGKTIESMLEENHLPYVDLLKMDIEGSEYEVLLSTPPRMLARIDRIAMRKSRPLLSYNEVVALSCN